MANDFIKIDNSNVVTAPFANDLLNLLSAVAGLQQKLVAISGRFGHLNDGATYTALETKYGIPANSGTLVNACVLTLLSTLNADPNYQALLNRIG